VMEAGGVDSARASLERDGLRVHILGRACEDPERTIHFRPKALVGRRGRFTPV
jgi:hypothetical protein